MRKEIQKFRAWDGLNKKMSFWTMNDLCTWDSKDEKPSALDDWMEYTGLKDKKGKEIYEGDIIKTLDKEIGVVLWEQETTSFIVSQSDDIDDNHWNGGLQEMDWKIIGNIYENPELLK